MNAVELPIVYTAILASILLGGLWRSALKVNKETLASITLVFPSLASGRHAPLPVNSDTVGS